MNRLFEFLRISVTACGFFLAWEHWKELERALDLLLLWIVAPVSGLTGIEGLFFGKEGQRLTGYAPSPYQRQSACNNLAIAASALLVLVLGWGMKAGAAICFVFLIFLSLSALNHLYSGLCEKNLSSRSYTRPFMTALLLVGMLPFLGRVVLIHG